MQNDSMKDQKNQKPPNEKTTEQGKVRVGGKSTDLGSGIGTCMSFSETRG